MLKLKGVGGLGRGFESSTCLQEFNRGLFDYLIASDDSRKTGLVEPKPSQNVSEKKGKKRKHPDSDREFGVTRGVDFKGVETVINVDAPATISRQILEAACIQLLS